MRNRGSDIKDCGPSETCETITVVSCASSNGEIVCHTRHVQGPASGDRLSTRQVSILDHLSTPEPQTLAELAAPMGVTPSTMSLAADRLEGSGYLRRSRETCSVTTPQQQNDRGISMKRTSLLLTCLACGIGAVSAQPLSPEDTFERLQALVGEWEADLPGFGKLTSSIRLISNGKAIEETLGTPADNETSVYSRDGHRILLTHFCALTPDGHVVRLASVSVKGGSNRIEFVLIGTTNLHSPSAPHMRRVLVTLTDADHFSERWTKTESGKDTAFDLHFTRHKL
jgi:hypothetical protein